MTISINWAARIINVPKVDMALIQSSPVEVRELDLNTFRLTLKDLEDDEAGMPFLLTHNHNPPFAVGGIILARVVDIVNDYTVTFEDAAYIVNLVGANTNLADRVNPNNVSIRSSNSAGLVQTREIEVAAFGGGVTINAVSGAAGTTYPLGTESHPVNNLADALLIATVRGLKTLFIQGNFPLGSGDVVSDYKIIGLGATANGSKTTLTFTAGASASNTAYRDLRVEGVLAGESNFADCVIGSITNAHCVYQSCGMVGPMVAPSGGGFATHLKVFRDCSSTQNEFVFDQNGSQMKTLWTNFRGTLRIINGTHAGGTARIHMNGGTVTIDATCSAGIYNITGDCTVVDESTGAAVVDAASVPLESASNIKYSIESLRETHQGFGERFYVDPVNGRDTSSGTADNTAFQTMTAALAACVSGRGDTIILLAPGAGTMTVTDRITISKEDVHVRGPGRGFEFKPSTANAGPVITVSGNNCSLSGFVVRTAAGSTTDDGILISGKFSRLNKLYVVGSGQGVGTGSGIVITAGDYHELINCESEKNGNCGLLLRDDQNATNGAPREVTVKGGNWYLNGNDGIGFTSTRAAGTSVRLVRILGANLHDNLEHGVHIDAQTQGTAISADTMMHNNTLGNVNDSGVGTFDATAACPTLAEIEASTILAKEASVKLAIALSA